MDIQVGQKAQRSIASLRIPSEGTQNSQATSIHCTSISSSPSRPGSSDSWPRVA